MAKEDKKSKGIGLPQTKGTFQIKGLTTGTQKDNFYKETLTKTNKPFRKVNFGLKTDKESTLYIELTGMEKDKVYFSKTTTVDGKRTTDVQEVAWKDRFKFNKEGYRLIGVNVGVTKTQDAKGNEVNDKKMLVDYDATKEIGDNLTDDQSVFVRGNIDYSHFETNNSGTKRAVKFIPSQVSLCKDVDFEAEDFVSTADFTQVLVFTGISQDENDKSRFIVSAKIINYNNIEEAEFIITNKDLATTFKKHVKPYSSIKVWGNIVVEKDTEEVEESEVWGESNDMEKVNSPTKRELVIVGADPKTIDKETYTEEAIDQAIAKINANKKAENDFGNSGESWGSGSVGGSTEDDDEAW